MVSNKNVRIHVTLSKTQKKWLDNFCKKHDITPSKYISWLLVKKAQEMIRILHVSNYEMNIEEIQEMDESWKFDDEETLRIIKTKWVE